MDFIGMSENFKKRQELEEAMMSKWAPILEKVGVSDEHRARTTAIVLENYLEHLEKDQTLIAEDAIQSSAFTGVHLALLGLISRTIPALETFDVVGYQAMPTPTSRIFTARWSKQHTKSSSVAGEEMFVGQNPGNFSDPKGWVDPYYTSNQVKGEKTVLSASTQEAVLYFANTLNPMGKDKTGKEIMGRPFIYANTMRVALIDDKGREIDYAMIPGAYNTSSNTIGIFKNNTNIGVKFVQNTTTGERKVVCVEASDGTPAAFQDVDSDAVAVVVDYDYIAEGEGNIAELGFEITDTAIDLIRRQLRGKFTIDAAYDLNVLHGINLETEITNKMKLELMAEINREIILDLLRLAAISDTLDFSKFATQAQAPSILGNYNDAHLVILDAINIMAAKIQAQGRLGKGNFVIGNPETLSFLSRVNGFVGSGVSFDGRDLSYAGILGGKMKFYFDPYFPKNKLLIGYKGPGALETGYMHCPYLPITATPNIINQETGDPSKIFFTRYGKTFALDKDPASPTYGSWKNHILMGEYQYAILNLVNFPNILGLAVW